MPVVVSRMKPCQWSEDNAVEAWLNKSLLERLKANFLRLPVPCRGCRQTVTLK